MSLISCLKIFIFIMLAATFGNAQAEYYSLYQSTDPVYIDGSTPAQKRHTTPPRTPSQAAQTSCGSYPNATCVKAPRRSNYTVTYDEPRHFNFVHLEEKPYNPDMATGDDDVDIHPEMEIN